MNGPEADISVTSVPAAEPIWISFEGAEPPSRRTIDAAIWVRFPAAFRALSRFTLGLSRRSRLRQAILRRSVLQAQGAWLRGDFELGLVRYAPDAVLTAGAQTRARLDFEPSYRGRDGVRDFIRTFQEAFGDQSYEPKWLVDLGEGEFVMLLHASLHGRASGAEVAQVSAHRLQIRNGLVVREEVHAGPADDWEPVVRAVGLDPADLPEAERLNAIGHEA
jgi:ketosteroid isomerase-like protein